MAAERDQHVLLIRRARPDEGRRLKEIAIASKGVWGYDADVVRAWADKGDFSAGRLEEMDVFVAERGHRVVAWSCVIPRGETAWLEDLWVEPEWIGKGVGAALFRHTAAHARVLGATTLEWEAEPNAMGFYEKMGAQHLRETTSEWGRTLSVMGIDLRG